MKSAPRSPIIGRWRATWAPRVTGIANRRVTLSGGQTVRDGSSARIS